MNEDKQAAALGRWLDSGGQGHAPEGIDADVLEAIYAIKPELAPPASVSIDDILGDVTEGPFAQDTTPVGGEVVPFPVPTSRPHEDFADEDASTPDEAISKSPWWIRWGTGGVAGSMAAAAAVLLVTTIGDSLKAPFDTPAASREMAASAREEMAASAREEMAAAREEMAASARRAKSERIAQAAAAAAGSSAPASAKKVAPPPPPATAAAPVAESKKARPTLEMGARNDAGLRDQLASSGSAAGSQLPAEGDLDALADAGDLANTGGWSDEAPEAEPVPELERADVEELQTGEVRDALSELAYAEEVEEEDAVVMNEPLDQQVDAYGFADKGADLESFDDVAQAAPSMAPDRKTKRTRGYQSRPAKEEARDFDVSGDWRSTVEPSWLAQIEGRLRLAEQHAQRQEYQTAATTLEDFIRPPTRAGLAVAYTAANYGLQAGDVSYALDLTDRGLALGGAGTPEHDRLVALRARLRSKSATKTYAQ